MSINKVLRPGSLVRTNRLFTTARSPSFKQNTKKYIYTEIPDFMRKHGVGVFGLFLTCVASGYGYGMMGGLGTRILVTGRPAPDTLTDARDPDRLIWSEDEIVAGGPADGDQGRSAPTEVYLVKHDQTRMLGYHKQSANGRKGLLNELVYHSLAKRIMPGFHPHVGLIESRNDEKMSSYTLFIESEGDNSNLLQHCKKLNEAPEEMMASRLHNLGSSLAFSALILSADNFMKNFVVVYQGNRQAFVYPIDFELLDDSKERSHEVEYVGLDKQMAVSSMRSFVASGALMDYQTKFSLSESMRQASGAENTADVGDAWTYFGSNSRDIHEFIIINAAEDIVNGKILDMYRRTAALTHDDVENIINRFDFIMTKDEMDHYKHALLSIITKTQEFVLIYDQEPPRPRM